MNAHEIKKGDHFEFQSIVWRITKKETIAVGTHSHSKTKIYARPLLGGGEKNFIFAHQDKMDYLEIIRKSAQVLSKTSEGIQIMDNISYETHDVSCDDNLKNDLNEGDNIIFVDLKGKILLIDKEG